MPTFERDDVSLYYEIQGDGFPILLFAPGGMRSAVSFWRGNAWDVIGELSPHFTVIAMDQRNAGASWAPVSGSRARGGSSRARICSFGGSAAMTDWTRTL